MLFPSNSNRLYSASFVSSVFWSDGPLLSRMWVTCPADAYTCSDAFIWQQTYLKIVQGRYFISNARERQCLLLSTCLGECKSGSLQFSPTFTATFSQMRLSFFACLLTNHSRVTVSRSRTSACGKTSPWSSVPLLMVGRLSHYVYSITRLSNSNAVHPLGHKLKRSSHDLSVSRSFELAEQGKDRSWMTKSSSTRMREMKCRKPQRNECQVIWFKLGGHFTSLKKYLHW